MDGSIPVKIARAAHQIAYYRGTEDTAQTESVLRG